MFASHEQKSCRARLGARHTTLCSKPLSTFEAGRFCSIHRKELSRLDAAYHKASERKESLQGVAITERSQISGLELPGDVETVRVVTVEYLEALKEECKGRKAVHERFFWDDHPNNGHLVRIRLLNSQRNVVKRLLRELTNHGDRLRSRPDLLPMGRRIEVQHRGVANVIVQDWVDQTSRLRLPNRQRLPLGALESEVSVVHHDVLRPAGYAVAHTAPKTFPVGPPPSHHRGYIDSDVPSTGQPWAREEREDVNPLGGYAGNTGRRDGRPEGAFSMGRVVKFGLFAFCVYTLFKAALAGGCAVREDVKASSLPFFTKVYQFLFRWRAPNTPVAKPFWTRFCDRLSLPTMPTLDQLPTIPTLEQLQKMASALRQLRGKVPAGEQLPESTLEKIKKKVLERSASLWTSASQLASEGAEAAAPVVSSVIDRTLRSEEVAKGAEQIGGLMRQVWGSLGTGRR